MARHLLFALGIDLVKAVSFPGDSVLTGAELYIYIYGGGGGGEGGLHGPSLAGTPLSSRCWPSKPLMEKPVYCTVSSLCCPCVVAWDNSTV